VYSNEARRIFYEEASRYGLQLNFEITPQPQTVFTWGSMKLSQRSLYNPREHLRMIIRHKLGYRVYFPGSYEWEKIAMIVAAAYRIKAVQAFAYICADLFTAQALMNEMKDEHEKTLYVQAVLKDSRGVEPAPIWLFKRLVFEGLRKGSLLYLAGDLNTDEGKRLVETAGKTLDIMNSSVPTLYKLARLAEVLKPLLDNVFSKPEDLASLPEIFAMDSFEKSSASTALSQLGPELLNLSISFLHGEGEDTIEFVQDPVVVNAVKLSLYNELLASKKPGQADSGRYYGTWTIGDDPSQLQIRDTLRVFGIVAPPLFSLKLVDGEKGLTTSYSSLGIALDVSSSMLYPPTKAARAKEAACGLVEEAKHRCMDLAVCYFNGVSLLKTYGTRYGEAQSDIASVVVKGNTDLATAISKLHSWSPEAAVIITDAEVVERDRVVEALEEMAEKSSVNIFLIAEKRATWIENRKWKTFFVKPGERFVEHALRLFQPPV